MKKRVNKKNKHYHKSILLRPIGNLKIRTKLFLGFFTIILLAVTVGAIGYQQTTKTEDAWLEISEFALPEMRALEDMRSGGLRIVSSINEFLLLGYLGTAMGEQKTELNYINEGKEGLMEGLEEFRVLMVKSGDDFENYQNIHSTVSSLLAIADEAVSNDTINAEQRDTVVADIKEELEEAEGKFLDSVNALLIYEREEVDEEAEEITEYIEITQKSLLFLSITSLFIGILLTYLFSYLIANPIISLRNITSKIAKGDFSKKVHHYFSDEIGELADSFNFMSSELQQLYSGLEKKVKEKTADIRTAQKKLQTEKAKLETFLESIGEGIIALDTKGRIVTLNKSAESMLGISLKKVIGQPFKSHIKLKNEGGNPLLIEDHPISDVMTKRKSIFLISTFIKKDKSKLYMATTIAPIIDGKKVIGLISTFRDMTKEKEVEQTKTDFISLASHQLRTPLTGIKWILQEADRMKNIKEWREEYLSDAVVSTERMISLVHDLLNVSRLDSGILAVDPKKTDLGEFISRLIKVDAQPVANAKKQKIVFKKPANKIITSIDQDLIHQVISNLVSNALRYSEKGKTITIGLKKKKGKIEISIKDQGIGVTKKDQEQLFEKFYRTKDAALYSTTGSGLGLYIIKKILLACKGTVSIESKKGKGSTFTVSIPTKTPTKKVNGAQLFSHTIS